METPLIGIKLLKTLKHWREANTYFQLHRTSLPNVSDINNFTTSFQSLIYNYFAFNYGTVKPQDLSKTQHPNKTVKNTKKDLKQLKLLGRNDHSFDMKISTLSKQIKTKLLSMKNAKAEKHVDITKQPKVKFWSTCKKLFNPSNSLTPSFSIDDCKKYFYNILHDPFHNKFRLPNWVPTLQRPTIPCNIDPPTYHKIATVIRKCKLRPSPCPFHHISIIVFKKCPMLRTILHQLIVECWRSATIPSLTQSNPLCRASNYPRRRPNNPKQTSTLNYNNNHFHAMTILTTSLPLYGCETWSTTGAHLKRLHATDKWSLRRILRLTYRDHVTNVEVRRLTQQPSVSSLLLKLLWSHSLCQPHGGSLPGFKSCHRPTATELDSTVRPSKTVMDPLRRERPASHQLRSLLRLETCSLLLEIEAPCEHGNVPLWGTPIIIIIISR
ncbi:hypothetical protein HELRODRAFT_182683 [Helobdella robusta]|uniref:Uncharacterized protein n=1 Tax=Helobdella robusta TaxID=6412 RepID=T1FIK8_HELRO|nr:hypothetical protein HELRODRAFT_182683 [Helobdella robusta]ESN90192.1 hypothetical protein HELRODRAFT_182683 [Helobdella robusta]